MVAAGRLKRTKRFTIKSLRGKKKEKRKVEEMQGKREKRGEGCRRILFVAIVSRGEKRLIHNRRVGNSRGKSLPVLFNARGKHPLSESRPNKIRSRERMCPVVEKKKD